MKRASLWVALAAATGLLLSGCQSTDGNQYRSDVYNAGQVNEMQDVLAVTIVAVNPAQVVVPASDYSSVVRQLAVVAGALAGAAIGGHGDRAIIGGIAGGVIGNAAASGITMNNDGTATVPGVQVIFRLPNGALKQSTQVGSLCEFRLGEAILVQTTSRGARVQPNNPMGCGAPAPQQPVRY